MKGTERWIGWRDDWDAVIGRGYGDDGTVCHDAGRLIVAVSFARTSPQSRLVTCTVCFPLIKKRAAPPPNCKRNRCTRIDGSMQGIDYKRHRSPKQKGSSLGLVRTT